MTSALGLAGMVLLLATGAQAAVLRPGLYEGLMLAVDGGGAVSGSFAQQGSCTFHIAGRANSQGAVVVRTVGEGAAPSIEGRLSAGKEGVTLILPGGQQLPGCGNVLPPLIDTGLALDLTHKGAWTQLVNVSADKTALRKSPTDAGRAYVVRGDVLGVVSEKADLLQVEFVNGQGRVVRGWIAAKDAKAIRAQ
ncbi:hypothetical protein VLK31_20475 [Variovorax sp. H27-G14]|uniref:hypothetical protein n=1 Tax=Variovorax sp. H27-G14 TaxID=3111914 RepID=UPI0038FBEC3E